MEQRFVMIVWVKWSEYVRNCQNRQLGDEKRACACRNIHTPCRQVVGASCKPGKCLKQREETYQHPGSVSKFEHRRIASPRLYGCCIHASRLTRSDKTAACDAFSLERMREDSGTYPSRFTSYHPLAWSMISWHCKPSCHHCFSWVCFC